MKNGKIYFASDFHLGIPDHSASLQREKLIVKWLSEIEKDAEAVYLLGDIFDFWFEYKKVVPKGYVRLLGKLAEFTDKGIPVHFFTGNHDIWMFDYFEEELNIPTYRQPIKTVLKGKTFFIGHGDGIGPRDRGFKVLKKLFTNRLAQWAFARIHPNLGITIADFWSKRSRLAEDESAKGFLGEMREWQVLYAKAKLQKEDIDYFIFGHRHLPLDIKISEKARFINLGDWISHYTYAVFDGNELELKKYNSPA